MFGIVRLHVLLAGPKSVKQNSRAEGTIAVGRSGVSVVENPGYTLGAGDLGQTFGVPDLVRAGAIKDGSAELVSCSLSKSAFLVKTHGLSCHVLRQANVAPIATHHQFGGLDVTESSTLQFNIASGLGDNYLPGGTRSRTISVGRAHGLRSRSSCRRWAGGIRRVAGGLGDGHDDDVYLIRGRWSWRRGRAVSE